MKKGLILTLIFGASAAFAAQVKMSPQELLSRVHSINQEEIGAGQMALKKASAKEVKDYAERLIKDHEKADETVKDLAKKERVTLTSMPMPKSMNETGKMVQHIGTTAKLKALRAGPDFDKAYVQAMDKGHADVISELNNVETSNPEMKKLIMKLLPQLHHHQQLAKALESSLIKEAR